MTVYYNENDPFAAQWLRNLISAGHIAAGDVDERDIRDVRPDDLKGYIQCHWFAGIGGWSYALRLAGWPDDRPVWTGSCPCQPFSSAGKQGGAADDRHLWPVWHGLIRECRPATVFGEQVAAAIRFGWLDGVFTDLEGQGYACGAAILGAHSVGAPHIRQRLFFVADSQDADRRRGERGTEEGIGPHGERGRRSASGGADGRLADSDGRHPGSEGLQRGGQHGQQPEDGRVGCVVDAAGERQHRGQGSAGPGRRGGAEDTGGLGHAEAGGFGIDRRPSGEGGHAAQPDAVSGVALGDPGRSGLSDGEPEIVRGPGRRQEGRAVEQSGRSFWSDIDWLPCTDGKARPTQPGIFPLAHGVPGRVGRLRAYGNAIVPQTAAAFIEAYLGTAP